MRQYRTAGFPRYVESEKLGRLVVTSQKDCLGKGTYGEVYKAVGYDNPSLQKAVKFLNQENILENEGIPATTLREVNAMKSISCCNVMDLNDVVFKHGTEGFAMIMDLMRGTMVNKVQQLANQFLGNNEVYASFIQVAPKVREFQERKPLKPLPAEYVKQAKVVAWQILNGVSACHAHGVMHRDIKPVNILWSNEDVIKVGDFGLARFQRGDRTLSFTVPPQTGEICTLHYRAPEVLLGDEKYGLRVDDWSVGCCIAEMFNFKYDLQRGGLIGCPLFSGTSEFANLMLIFDLCGTPTTKGYLHSTPWWTENFPKYRSRLRESLSLLDDLGYDLISKLLVLDPVRRASCRTLLSHPWFDDIRSEGLLSRFTAWDAGIKDNIVRMRTILEQPPPSPKYNPFWEHPKNGRLQSGRVQIGNDENEPPAMGKVQASGGIPRGGPTTRAHKRAREGSCAEAPLTDPKRMKPSRAAYNARRVGPYDEQHGSQMAASTSKTSAATSRAPGMSVGLNTKRSNVPQRKLQGKSGGAAGTYSKSRLIDEYMK